MRAGLGVWDGGASPGVPDEPGEGRHEGWTPEPPQWASHHHAPARVFTFNHMDLGKVKGALSMMPGTKEAVSARLLLSGPHRTRPSLLLLCGEGTLSPASPSEVCHAPDVPISQSALPVTWPPQLLPASFPKPYA